MKRIILIAIPLLILSVLAADSILDPVKPVNLKGIIVVPNAVVHKGAAIIQPIHVARQFHLRTSLGILDRSLDRQLQDNDDYSHLAGEDMHIWLKSI